MKGDRKQLGEWGEDQAIAYLESLNYRILERNVYSRYGEIDIIAERLMDRAEVTVFVEVKTRTTAAYGYPEEAVDRKKMEHILAAAAAYLQEHPERGEHWQVDVIAIERYPDEKNPKIRHF